MKLVDILARELKEWPDQYYQIYQDSGGNLIGTLSDNDLEDCDSEDLPYDPVTIAWDGNSAVVERSEWQEAVDALYPKLAIAEEWNGEGLPPVGIPVEYQRRGAPNGKWYPTTINFLSGQHVIFCDSDGDEIRENPGDIIFRPARTPEQIAADLREKSAEELYLTINWNDTPSTWANLSQSRRADYFKAIDAGWNKFEIIDEPKS